MPSPPAWVAKDLQNILGLDEETIKQVIIPDLEIYSSQVRLKGHLQDFLGSAPSARSFIERYVSLRFPSLNPTTSLPPPPLKSQTLYAPVPTTVKPTAGSSSTLTPPPDLNSSSVNAAFGPGGRVYQKSPNGVGYVSSSSVASGGSAAGSSTSGLGYGNGIASGSYYRGGSGTVTPRAAGALTIHEAKPRSNQHIHGENGGAQGSGNRKKGEEKIWDAPKSKETLRLEAIVERLREVQAGGKMDEVVNPCFCQARNHELSRYTPACPTCGLILCTLQISSAPCPSCQSRLYTASGLARLIVKVEDEVAAQVAIEQAKREERERARLERLTAQAGGGAFPSLPNSGHITPNNGGTNNGGRKVLTIGSGKPGSSKGKGRATITTTTYTTIPVSTPDDSDADGLGSKDVVNETIVGRPREGPLDRKRIEKELSKEVSWRAEVDRPWGDLRKEKQLASLGVGGKSESDKAWNYVEKQLIQVMDGEEEGRRRRSKKKGSLTGQGIGQDGRVVVGAGQA